MRIVEIREVTKPIASPIRNAYIDLDFPPRRGGVGSERHAAARMVIPSMLARASAGVR